MKIFKDKNENKVPDIDQRCANTLRFLAMDMINKANSGHPGIALGAAPAINTLFTKHLKIYAKQAKWINRDRFILSAGHGSSLLYAMLHLSGFNVTIEDLKNFRQLNSKTPGHPEIQITEGVDATTGPLGQGLGMALGMAIAEDFLGKQYNRPKMPIIDHYTFALCGDGCLQEGISQEMLSLAGKLNLKKLIILFDSNKVQLDSNTNLCTNEKIKDRVQSANWDYICVTDGNDTNKISAAIKKAKKAKKPTFIEIKTVIGFGSPKQGSSSVHGAPLGIEDTDKTKTLLHWNYNENFYVPDDIYEHFGMLQIDQENEYLKWVSLWEKYLKKYPEEASDFENAINNNFAIDWDKVMINSEIKSKDSTRNISSIILKDINNQLPKNILAGSADLSASTKIKGINGIYGPSNSGVNAYKGNHIMFGVREFAMGTIINGIKLHQGLHAYGSTFFVFSDYLKPAIRLACLMNLNSGFIFSHDSIMVGEDGPTHQPVEQLTMLRTIPNMHVFKPCNHHETKLAFKYNFEQTNQGWALLTTRQEYEIPNSNNAKKITNTEFNMGAYILDKNKSEKFITILASGYEVTLALKLKILLKKHVDIRVVSVPCLNLFLKQGIDYQNKIIGNCFQKIVIDFAEASMWYRLLDKNDQVFSIDDFGKSGKDNEICADFGLSAESIYKKIINKK